MTQFIIAVFNLALTISFSKLQFQKFFIYVLESVSNLLKGLFVDFEKSEWP